jgi:hypothetical protein
LEASVVRNWVSRPPFMGQGREREGMNEQEWPAMKVLQIDQYIGSFVLCLMAFDGGEMTRYYWVICDHEMLNYCGIFKCLSQLKLQS